MPLFLIVTLHLIIGVIAVEICLRFDKDGREVLTHLNEANPIAYVLLMLLGSIFWPIAVYDTVRRVRRHRRSATQESVLLGLPSADETPKEPRKAICPMPCPTCKGSATLYSNDERAGGWHRVECLAGHWGDLRPDSILIPEEHRVPWEGS